MNATNPLWRFPWIAEFCVAGMCVSLLLVGCHRAPAGAEAPTATDSKAEATSTEEGANEGVTLKPEEVEKTGIVTTVAASTSHVPETAGFGVVVAHETIAQSVAEIATATAIESQSRAALARVQRLTGTPGAMAADAQESAVRQAAVDEAALTLAKQRGSAIFGQNPPWKDNVHSVTATALAGGETKLVRVTFPLGALGGALPTTLRLAHLNGGISGQTWKSSVLWDAPADLSVPGKSFFALLKGADAGEGERLLVWAPIGAADSGVRIPAAAAVISGGKYWCYVERKPGVFVRTEIDASSPLADGYFVKEGVAAGDKVVTTSAGELLARELNPSTAAE